MKNIFILYIPPNNSEATVHYEDTIRRKIEPERIYKYVDRNLRNKLHNIFLGKRISVWGSRNSEANRAKFDKMQEGDLILIVEGAFIKFLGKVAAKTINPDLSRELWKNLRGETVEGWDLIYFIANPVEIDLPFNEFKKLFDYKENFTLRGFMSVSDDKLQQFYEQYDDLYSILIRLKKGENVYKKKETGEGLVQDAERVTIEREDINEILSNKELSDHVKMQWKLVGLGLKMNSKVWVPRNDQKKITTEYGFSDFEREFTSGIDINAKYVENIDVVWKKEYQIDGAFEIENSTSIYSGLLRFSDLKIVAPNSNYPLYIVAQQAKKSKVRSQVYRPTFERMQFHEKVRFLSYEKIEEVDKFFEDTSEGLNHEILYAKSEEL